MALTACDSRFLAFAERTSHMSCPPDPRWDLLVNKYQESEPKGGVCDNLEG